MVDEPAVLHRPFVALPAQLIGSCGSQRTCAFGPLQVASVRQSATELPLAMSAAQQIWFSAGQSVRSSQRILLPLAAQVPPSVDTQRGVVPSGMQQYWSGVRQVRLPQRMRRALPASARASAAPASRLPPVPPPPSGRPAMPPDPMLPPLPASAPPMPPAPDVPLSPPDPLISPPPVPVVSPVPAPPPCEPAAPVELCPPLPTLPPAARPPSPPLGWPPGPAPIVSGAPVVLGTKKSEFEEPVQPIQSKPKPAMATRRIELTLFTHGE